MKYETKIYYLNDEEKKNILQKLLSYDHEALKKIYNAYRINYKTLKIKVLKNGFNTETAKKELNGFYFTFDGETLIYNDSLVHLYSKNDLLHWFSNYGCYKVDELRRKNTFYIFEGERTPTKKDDFLIKSDRLKNIKIGYASAWINVVYNNRYEATGKNTRNNKKVVLNCGSCKDINNIIDKSGYIKYNLLENLKKKAEEIRKNKNLKEFQDLEKSEIIKKVNSLFDETMQKIFSICDLKNIEFMQKLYDGYRTKNLQYYIKLYNKIIKLDYKKLEDFQNDLNSFYLLNAKKIKQNVFVAIAAGNIWINGLSNPEKKDLTEIEEETIFINENEFLFNNKYYNLNGEAIAC